MNSTMMGTKTRERISLMITTGCLMAAGLFFGGCSEDDPVQPDPPLPKIEFEDLTERDDALFNLELAYNQRRMDEYDRLLDEGFIFYFSDYDVWWRDAPESWDRQTEVLFSTVLMDPNQPGGIRFIKVSLTLDYPDSNWVEEPANPDHPDASWWHKSVRYELFVETAGGWKLHSKDQTILITVRWDDTLGHWRVVRVRDGTGLAVIQLAPSLGVEPVYWGTLKAGFNPVPGS
jgi:hypothetical protein